MEKNRELHPALEAEISRLSAEILRRREGGVEGREALKQSLEEGRERAGAPQPPEQISKETVLPGYALGDSPETRLFVESIIDKLWHDGDLDAAWKKANKGGPLALDLFHDALTGAFHDAMKQRGIL
jgi:hypothetical protein